jgi:hypothetical protein
MSHSTVTLLRASLPGWLERRVVVIPPGGVHAYARGDWRDAIAVVEDGSVVLQDAAGGSLRLAEGAVFCLGCQVVEIRNETRDAAVIATARRRVYPGS